MNDSTDNKPDTNLSRRTLVKAAAWSVPVISVAVAAPAAAGSSTCPALSLGEWPATSPVSGTLGNGTNGWNLATGPGTGYYQSQKDNGSYGWGAPQAMVSTSTTFEAVAGTTYTFTYTAVAGYGNNRRNYSGPQRVELVVDGQVIWTGNTRPEVPEFPGGSPIPIANYYSQTTPATYAAVFTATSGGTKTVEYRFTMPGAALSANPSGANDDIWISVPQITCA